MAMIMKVEADVTEKMIKASQDAPGGACPLERAIAAAVHTPLRDVMVGVFNAYVWAAGGTLEAVIPAETARAVMNFDEDKVMEPFTLVLEFTDGVTPAQEAA